MTSGSWHNLWRLRRYLRPYLRDMLILLVSAALATAASLAVPMLARRVVDGPVARGDERGLFLLGGLAVLLGVLEAGLILLRRWTQARFAIGMEATIRDDLYAHLQRLPVAFHDRWQSGQLLSRITGDLGVIRRFLAFGLVFLVVNLATYVTVVILLVRLYWPLGVLVGVSAVPLFLVSRRFVQFYFTASRQLQDELGDLATRVEESAHGVRVIRSFGRREHMTGLFTADAAKVRATAVRKARLLGANWAQFDLVPTVTMAIVLVVGALAVARGSLSLGSLVAFVSLQTMLTWPIDMLGWIIANGQEAMSAANRVYEVFDTEPSVVDRPGAVAADRDTLTGELRFEGVTFTYPGSAEPVLDGVDLAVRPGETMAVVGVTGCGKTTLVSLVPRLYDVSGGAILLDGRDVRDYRLDSLRRVVGVAFEEPTLFSMSVRENLTLGRIDATDEEIAEALAVAQAEFVYDLPWGLNTRVGEQGLSLSGGQRQRLALARAILGRPRVLVLDDPLSALDVHTEALVEQALERVLYGVTALVVVHRPSTVALADRVALLSGGRIVAIGTHSELLATVPEYRAVLSAESDGLDNPVEPDGPDRGPVDTPDDRFSVATSGEVAAR